MTDNLLTEEIPEKFKNPETGSVQLDALLRSYKELEQRLSQNPSAPKSPEEYCIDCSHGLFETDMEVNRRLHARGMTQEQAQEVYNLAAEKMVPMIAQLAGDFRADREVEKLISHFGGADQWREMSRQLLGFGQQNLPADVLENLASSFEGVLALHRMMKSEEPGLKKAPAAASASGEQDLQSMMRNPRYWRERDPAYIAKVTEGFRKIYGGK
ncbi:MAG: hypothetical protein IT559_06990 [Alphaproteobacteria bacterium]|nr:hypothetical protein [Alphaproteobacteria bacterium]